MEDFAMFDEVGCEEFFVEDADYLAWLAALELDSVNGELQVIADSEASAAVDAQWEELIGNQFLCSEFESSHVEA